jgi:peptidyl-tRNA hydrolase, PTH1 family
MPNSPSLHRLRLIVGLGNPGADYAKTRHNAGFWFCERLAQQIGVGLNREARFNAIAGQAREQNLWLLMPQNFMNRSGGAVRALTQFYRIEPSEMLVVHDELDLPPGRLQLRLGGGLGGHNGLKDITAQLGTQDYWRLRVGIGHPGDRNEVANYVLKPPLKEQQNEVDTALDRALQSWPQLAEGNFEAAMKQLNTRPVAAKPEPLKADSPSQKKESL